MKPKLIIFPILAIGLASFIIYTIYAANTGTPFIFIKLIQQIPYGDKLGHFLLIGSMSLLLNLALQVRKIQISKFSFLLGSVILFTIITIEEFSQMFFPNRTFDLVDLFFNYLGIFVFGKLAIFIGKSIWKKDEII